MRKSIFEVEIHDLEIKEKHYSFNYKITCRLNIPKEVQPTVYEGHHSNTHNWRGEEEHKKFKEILLEEGYAAELALDDYFQDKDYEERNNNLDFTQI